MVIMTDYSYIDFSDSLGTLLAIIFVLGNLSLIFLIIQRLKKRKPFILEMRPGMTIPEWEQMIGEHNISKGFVIKDRKREFWQLTMLIVSEVSELAEDYYIHGKITKEGRRELADVAIRLFDFCYRFEIDLEQEMIEKMQINMKRPIRHGKKGV